ncbi:peptidoglycan bridge formation glycyltransferase FemA/FemB family protein [Flexivirga caeni]|uniref:Peptidoglycan bridge formation glycyltransferase FemA/FemB family protein n=1 Tax=Flexivirga caeni TaxID=2294115 RepID=A0A3M9LY49_9MICO|nr:peptidoglycan bridge formation glycyltransferase FemA/FemB family protein [Flexivirga caeni]
MTPCTDRDEWDATVLSLGGHPLQLWGWGALKSRYAWSAERLVVEDGGVIGAAQVLYRRLPWPLKSLAYLPRGPIAAVSDRAAVLSALAGHVKSTHGSVTLSIEPDWADPHSPLEKGVADEEIARLEQLPPTGWLAQVAAAGFRRSANTGLIPRTLIVDLSPDEDDILKAFNSSTRQNVRKSFRAPDVRFGLVTDEGDLTQVLAINKETGRRAGFAVHDDGYHRAIRDLMGERSQLLAAWEGDDVVAFVWLVVSDATAFELYGGVSPRGMKLRLNYGLKFHAMKHVKAQGVSRYDFNGLLNDGISDFKRQFSKHEDLLIGTWDKPLSPLYPAFATALPKVRHALKRGLPVALAAVLSRSRRA